MPDEFRHKPFFQLLKKMPVAVCIFPFNKSKGREVSKNRQPKKMRIEKYVQKNKKRTFLDRGAQGNEPQIVWKHVTIDCITTRVSTYCENMLTSRE